MSKTINIPQDVGAHIMLSAFKKDIPNRKYIIDLLFKSLDEHAIATFLQIMTDDDTPQLPKIGDVVRYLSDRYDKIDYDTDVLKDHNVFCEGNIHGKKLFYAIITEDASYRDEFNPWCYKFHVNVITNDDKGNLILIKKDIKWEDLDIVSGETVMRDQIKKVYETIKEGTPKLPF
jgi:hypothetical protein